MALGDCFVIRQSKYSDQGWNIYFILSLNDESFGQVNRNGFLVCGNVNVLLHRLFHSLHVSLHEFVPLGVKGLSYACTVLL